MFSTNTVMEGDCLELMKALPDSSIDLIATDPPYFKIKGNGSENRFEWWDRQWDKPVEFLKWIDQLAEQWQRILKPNGSLYCFASPKMSARVEVLLGERFNVLNNIRWVKEAGWHQKASKDEARCYKEPWESIIFCEHYGADNIAKGEAGYQAKCDELRGFVFEPLRQYLESERQKASLSKIDINVAMGFRPRADGMSKHYFSAATWQMPTREAYSTIQSLAPGYFTRPYKDLRQQYEELRQQYEELRQQYEELRRPFSVSADVPYTDVWTYPTVSHHPGKHPCEKPLEMMEHIVQASSRPGGVILDCFCGSGNTLVAAKKHDRQFIGIDIDPHWVDVAKGKLGQTQRFVSTEDRLQWLETQVQAQGTKIKRLENQQLDLFHIGA